MKIKFIFIITFIYQTINAQIVNPVCDDPVNIPLTINYTGFIIYDDVTLLESASENSFQSLRFTITADSINGNEVFQETHVIPLNLNGFFNVEIGSKETRDFTVLLDFINDNIGIDYFINLYIRESSWNSIYVGSKKLLATPYAYIANALGGIGPRGEDGTPGVSGVNGQDGINGQDGASGIQGEPGANGFGKMIWRNSPPSSSGVFTYIDDGTNTSDGNPSIMFLINGEWTEI